MELRNEMARRNFTFGRCLDDHEDETGEFIKKIHYLPESCVNANGTGTKIQEFFRDAHILITGGTGFMGKVTVEKLLASCPNLSTIYLLIREKKGHSMEQRFDELFNDDVFQRLRDTVPDFRRKIVAIEGDCSQLFLGMSPETVERLSKIVNVIIHGAATVGFNEPLRTATHINVLGVKEMIKFASNCSNLKSMVHISTAYSNATLYLDSIEEKFYPPAIEYQELIDLVDSLTEEKLEEITPKLIDGWPNTYSFTKQVAEDLIKREGQHLPLAVFRPGIVTPTYKEPIRGWADNYYGLIGFFCGVWREGVRVFPGPFDKIVNWVPVDISVNAVLAVACEAADSFRMKKGILIYNNVATERNKLTIKEMMHWNIKYGENWPSIKSSWYPVLFSANHAFFYRLMMLLVQTIPAYILDTFVYLLGRKTRYVKIQRSLNKFMVLAYHFFHYHWNYSDNNLQDLWKSLSDKDKEIFPFEIAELDWDYYCHGTFLGLRTYLMKEPLETIPAAKVKYRQLFLRHKVAEAFLWLALLWPSFHLVKSRL